MGQGGYIIIVNRTLFVWTRTYLHEYQINNWSFPEKMNPGETRQEYIEWNGNIFKNKSNDAGDVIFVLGNTNMTLDVRARVINGKFNLKVFLFNIHTPLGDAFDLGWNHNGTVTFYLIEKSGQFSAPNLDTHWMTSNLPQLRGRSMRNMCIPGSHDSGMSERGADTAFAHDCNVITQTTNILGQLEYGARYFDIRPVISAGKYFTGHYGKIPGSWQGANGQSISSIIGQINYFTAAYNELIILNISHDRNTDVGADSYRPFTQEEWNGFFSLLTALSHLYVAAPDPINVQLTDLSLGSFIGNGKPAVVIVIEPECDLGEYAHKGFYKKRNYNVYNNYSNTNDLNEMINDQIRKMQEQRPDPNATYFLLSWTLTQSDGEATFCYLGVADSILTLANKANSATQDVLKYCTPQTYPNIFFIDDFANTKVTELVIEINSQAAQVPHSILPRDPASRGGAEP